MFGVVIGQASLGIVDQATSRSSADRLGNKPTEQLDSLRLAPIKVVAPRLPVQRVRPPGLRPTGFSCCGDDFGRLAGADPLDHLAERTRKLDQVTSVAALPQRNRRLIVADDGPVRASLTPA
jgi:hypothetical protein